jgi:hypothetical protein
MGYLDWLGLPSKVEKETQKGLRKKADKMNNALLQFMGTDYPLLNPENDRENVYKGYMINPDVYSIVNLITNAMRSVSWVLYEVEDQPKFRKYKRLPSEAKQYNFENVVKTKNQALTEVHDSNNKLYKLLEKPNELQGWGEFI